MDSIEKHTKPFDVKQSIQNAQKANKGVKKWVIQINGKSYHWEDNSDRVGIVRDGLPYESLESVSKKMHSPVKSILNLMGIPQTTYNKKKSEHSLMDSRDSELILLIIELIDYGIEVFNNEEDKFLRWLKKPNMSLGGYLPESMLDTITGIEEVKNCLNRIEYGNLA